MGIKSFAKKQQPIQDIKNLVQDDPTSWLANSELANFLLMNTTAIKYMCLLGYTFLHGCKLFAIMSNKLPKSYRFISLILQCTGGGILVPIFINTLPVPLAQDAYPIAITVSFLLNEYTPVLRDILHESHLFHSFCIILYEIFRASVVVKMTAAAGDAIPPSDFDGIAVFGPIFCGAIAGCGGIFLPLSKGLAPIEKTGLQQTMISSLLAAAFYHLFVHTSLSAKVVDAPKKAQVLVALFLVCYHMYALLDNVISKARKHASVKVEDGKKSK